MMNLARLPFCSHPINNMSHKLSERVLTLVDFGRKKVRIERILLGVSNRRIYRSTL